MKKDHDPKVSVIIPLYNQEQFVTEAIESVLNQTYRNIEVIVVNDGSTDNPFPVLEKYKDSIILTNQENRGLAGARNTGIKKSSGEYLQFLDADDFLYPGKIKLQLEFSMEKQADISYCEMDRYLNDSRTVIHREIGKIDDIFLHYYNLWFPYPTPIHSLLFKKNLFNRFGLFPEDLRANEDRYLLSLMAARGVVFVYFPFRGGFYRVHGGSMNFDRLRMIESKIKYYKKINRALGEQYILEKTGYSGRQMMHANLTHVYLLAVSEGTERKILRQVKRWYKKEGIEFDVTPIPSRFKTPNVARKFLSAYVGRWLKK